VAKLVHKITTKEPNLDTGFEDVSMEAKDLLWQMLSKSPNERPSATECLEHRWFKTKTISAFEANI